MPHFCVPGNATHGVLQPCMPGPPSRPTHCLSHPATLPGDSQDLVHTQATPARPPGYSQDLVHTQATPAWTPGYSQDLVHTQAKPARPPGYSQDLVHTQAKPASPIHVSLLHLWLLHDFANFDHYRSVDALLFRFHALVTFSGSISSFSALDYSMTKYFW